MRPWIDQRHLQVGEMPHVSGCERRPPRNRDPGDLRITHVYGLADARSFGCQGGSRATVEVQHTMVQVRFQDLLESRLQRVPPPSIRQQCQAETRFQHRDARDPDRFWSANDQATQRRLRPGFCS